ncbi:hypothetical protein QP923_07695 [Corynebacterium sp. MSK151]|uniref:hypothetical protein n=1 Tax=unclassified Corynebacterium TaxID=2624378 RepID=UPI00254D6E59|nr:MULTISPECIES: hypothetical protein [unclassified Corynebacterium]MDK8759478.1 hypothetical protein [Corynebacterium sp. MSK151]MDK8847513.1 hypothetical protein [Corynebacterium sp. MSK047]
MDYRELALTYSRIDLDIYKLSVDDCTEFDSPNAHLIDQLQLIIDTTAEHLEVLRNIAEGYDYHGIIAPLRRFTDDLTDANEALWRAED